MNEEENPDIVWLVLKGKKIMERDDENRGTFRKVYVKLNEAEFGKWLYASS